MAGMRKGTCKRVSTPSGMRRLCKDQQGRVRFKKGGAGGVASRGTAKGLGKRAKRKCARYGRASNGRRVCRKFRKA